MEFILFAIGLVIGLFIVRFMTGFNSVGELIITSPTEPDEAPYIFLSLAIDVNKLASKKSVALLVDTSKFNNKELLVQPVDTQD
ncbi:MAG: hypothetical protein K9L62_01960 [Vallitaleaceae bacterium]|nr:hypothetical protein [Vallitaleaceae bacterium]